MKVYDITRRLAPTIAVWPGDQEFERDWTSRIEEGAPANVGRIRMSLHTGTHADAPFHFRQGTETIDELALEVFVGEALVVDATGSKSIDATTLDGIPSPPPRILFRTDQSRRADAHWDPDYPHVDLQLAPYLAERGVLLLGTDSPSVDPFHSAQLVTHHALADHGIHILENLQLEGVPTGVYLLVAAPLKLEGMDGSPVRALLIEIAGNFKGR